MSSSDIPPASDPSSNLVGRILADRYRILSLIGEGAMGSVYLGEHLRIGRRDAIKVLRQDIARDRDAINRFARGARNVSAIRHPNVCTIYDFSNTEDGLQYLAMEFVSGESLKDILQREGRLELRRAVAIAKQVADALQAAHDAGIVHRDLKPGNIMISTNPDGTDGVKVVDFDIAKGPTETEGDEVTRLGFVVGTPEYMSPEQLMGERLDGRSDVYSLGIVLFRMLTGGLPFRAASTREIMVQRLTVTPLRLEAELPGVTFPPALQLVLDRALARGREERYATAADFARDVGAAIDPSFAPLAVTPRAGATLDVSRPIPPTVVAPVPSVALPAPPQRGGLRRTVIGAAVMGLLAALAVIGAFVVLNPGGGTAAGDNDVAQEADPGAVDPGRPPTGGGETVGTTSNGTEPVRGPENRPPQQREQTDRGTSVEPPQPQRNPPDTRPADLFPAGIAATLQRQLTALLENPGPAQLNAIRDTARLALDNAAARTDSASAAFTLAQVAWAEQDIPTCRRWTRLATQLGAAGIAALRPYCE